MKKQIKVKQSVRKGRLVKSHTRNLESKTAISKASALKHIGEKNGGRYTLVKRIKGSFKDPESMMDVIPVAHYGILAKINKTTPHSKKGSYVKILGTPRGSSSIQVHGNPKKLLK